jgi:hypothetical protein
MKQIIILLFFSLQTLYAQTSQKLLTTFELSNGTETVTYQEGIDFLEKLSKQYPFFKLEKVGTTDVGKPIHTFIYSLDKDFDAKNIHKKEKNIILINNAIHAGEPDGVDATLLLLRDIAENPKLQAITKNTVVVVIPFYNVDGVLNRNSFSRANQNGPKSYGFRGNAKNLDLNRDFIKMDSENAHTFAKIFHHWQPDIFLDNHVTNGADYQYTFTCLMTQPDKLGKTLGSFLKQEMYPKLENKMKEKNWDMIQYVNVHETALDSGFVQFVESPRYSTGYTTLFQTIGFAPETHMLKPFAQRVQSNYSFMLVMLEYLETEGKKIKTLRKKALEEIKNQKEFVLDWKNKKDEFEWIDFKGYEASFVPSKVTGKNRLFYDRNKPFTKKIKFFNTFKPSIIVQKPVAYIIPAAYKEVINRLKVNEIKMEFTQKDEQKKVGIYYISSYKTVSNAYENHYLHYNTEVKKEIQTLIIPENSVIVYTNQNYNRYIIETLEPQAPDSFFNWNFFDGILQQKEGFSSYIFEETAEKLLNENPDLKQKFEEKKQKDIQFSENAYQQLEFIYQNSPYYEKTHLKYPILRIEK